MDLSLNDVHVLITGSSGGIGFESAKLFLEQGARITAHYNTNNATLEPLLLGYPGRIRMVQANLTIESEVVRLFDADAFGPVQIAIINHGIGSTARIPIRDMTLDQWESILDANLTSSFLVAREYLKSLAGATEEAKECANIVFIGSTAGKFGEAGHGNYAASKSAIMYGLTLTLKNEIVKIAPKGRVNCVAPGWVRTPMAEAILQDPDVVYQALATTPLRKIALPHDVATQIIVLASSTISGHVSGQILMVEGGMEGRLLNQPKDIFGTV